ncbi:MAG TPA: mevalonate kinase, partial [Anaerolineales bacterium]|nr:mevalonate kinase [Anaerolineales bacterium]
MKSSAPGKVILFGEHAVVYGRPALAVPVTQVSAQAEVTISDRPGIWIDLPDLGLNAELTSLPADQPVAALVHNLLSAWKIDPFPRLIIRVSSTIPVASGLGSGAAVSVALTRALAGALQHPVTDEQVSAYAFEIERLHHGTPSGIDNNVITYARPVIFTKGSPIQMLKVAEPFTIVIGYTGIAAPTRDSVSAVRQLWQADPTTCEAAFDGIGFITRMAREAIETGMWRHLGPLMNENHTLLRSLTVSSPELDRLVEAARHAGALGAKLSGGGRGGNMIALAPESGPQAVAAALTAAGATS